MTIWFNRTAGEGPAFGTPHVEPLPDEPETLLVHTNVPDWITNPATGTRERVEGVEVWERFTCPCCKHDLQNVRALRATYTGHADRELLVYECPAETKFVVMVRGREAPKGT